MNDTTLLIPLYKTMPLLHFVTETVDDHVAQGGRVLLSDQHCLDDAAAVLRDRYADNDQVTVHASNGGGDWVTNCNLLISLVETDFFRIQPHDDSVEASSTRILRDLLVENPAAVLAHGFVRAQDMATGQPLPERDEPRFPLLPGGVTKTGTPEFTMALMWTGAFSGSFKAVMRTEMIQSRGLFIRPTPSLRHSERAWLGALSCVGEFVFTEEAFMTKRYWSGSLTDSWTQSSSDFLSVAEILASYYDDLIDDPALAAQLRFNAHLNALRWSVWLDGYTSSRPPFAMTVPSAIPPDHAR